MCRLCGRDLEPHRRPGSSVYCRRCVARADREVAKTASEDYRECGRTFPTRTRSIHYCSDACRAGAARRARAETQRKRDADPEKRALRLARTRTWAAARRAKERGRGGRPNA